MLPSSAHHTGDACCRACLKSSTSKKLYDIFSPDSMGLSIAGIFNKLVNPLEMEIKQDKSLSSYFCGPCKSVVLNFYHLECKLKENQQLLLNFEGKLNKVDKENTIESLNDEIKIENHFFKFIMEEESDNQRVMVPVANAEAEDMSVNEVEEVIVIITNDTENEESKPTYPELTEFKTEGSPPEVCKREEKIIITNNDINEESKPIYHELGRNRIEVTSAEDSINKPKKKRPLRKFICKVCNLYCLKKTSLRLHMNEYHPDVNIEDLKGKSTVRRIGAIKFRICNACDLKFEDNASYQAHIKTHHPYICDLCGKNFPKKSYLEDHKVMHQSFKRYVCNYCGKSYRQRCTFKVHLRIHMMPGSYVCETCGQAFNAKSTMNMHISLVHLKDKQFPCELCGRTFPMKQTLMKHITRHNKERERTFKCKDCPMTYWEASSLRRHVSMKHAGEVEKVPCNICGRRYTTKSILKRHMKVRHGQNLDVSDPLETKFVKIEEDIDVREEMYQIRLKRSLLKLKRTLM